MRIIGRLRQRRFRMRLNISILLLLTVFIVFSTILLYRIAEKTIMDDLLVSNRQVMQQIRYNVEYMDDMARNLLNIFFYNADGYYLMYQPLTDSAQDIFEATNRMGRIRKNILLVNPYAFSVSFFNGETGMFYNSYSGLFTQDPFLRGYIDSQEVIRAKPVFRNYETISPSAPDRYLPVFTYTAYDRSGSTERLHATFLNVKADWLLQRIDESNGIGSSNGLKVYLFGSEGDIIATGDEETADMVRYYKTVIADSIASGVTESYESDAIDGEKYFVSFLSMDASDITIVTTRRHDEIFGMLYRFRDLTLLIMSALICTAWLTSWLVSKRLYRPLMNIVHKVEKARGPPEGGVVREDIRDEFGLLDDYYTISHDELSKSRNEISNSRRVLRVYYLKSIINDSMASIDTLMAEAESKGYWRFPRKGSFICCLLALERPQATGVPTGFDDSELLRFSVSNIAEEVFDPAFLSETIDYRDDQIAIILASRDGEIDARRILESCRVIQQHVHSFFKYGITVGMSSPFHRMEDLTQVFQEACRVLEYRFVFGRGQILTPEMIAGNQANPLPSYDPAHETNLLDAIRSGKGSDAERIVDALVGEIARLELTRIRLSIAHLSLSVGLTIDEVTRLQCFSGRMEESGEVLKRLGRTETLSEFREVLLKCLRDFLAPGGSCRGRQEMVVQTSKIYIHSRYMNASLCTTEIATVLQLSPAYLAKTFKQFSGISLNEYINRVRMDKAAELLAEKKYSMVQIGRLIGIDSEASFYRLFRKRFGVSPRNYAVTKSLGRIG